MDIVCPLWKRACGGQFGFNTWVSLKSAIYGPRIVDRPLRVRRMRPGRRVIFNVTCGEDVMWWVWLYFWVGKMEEDQGGKRIVINTRHVPLFCSHPFFMLCHHENKLILDPAFARLFPPFGVSRSDSCVRGQYHVMHWTTCLLWRAGSLQIIQLTTYGFGFNVSSMHYSSNILYEIQSGNRSMLVELTRN